MPSNILFLAGESCKVLPHLTFNCGRGLIRLKQFDVDDMEEFDDHMQKQPDLESVEKPHS